MNLLSDEGWDELSASFQPWLIQNPGAREEQKVVHGVPTRKAGATVGKGCYISPSARVLTQRLKLGDDSWIAGGAILRGNVEIGRYCSVNPYAHIAGNVKIGDSCRIAGLASIYGFNHGTDRTDIPVKDQKVTSRGVILREDVWVGAHAVIVDGVEIGPHCVIAAGSVVTKSFPAYTVIGGNPAEILRERKAPAPPKATTDSRDVCRLLFSEDPYASFHSDLAPDLQGWDSQNPILRKTIAEIRPRLIVEVGTWKGASAIHMGAICRELQLDAEIVCVDTWLGNWQHWARTSGIGSRVDLKTEKRFSPLCTNSSLPMF